MLSIFKDSDVEYNAFFCTPTFKQIFYKLFLRWSGGTADGQESPNHLKRLWLEGKKEQSSKHLYWLALPASAWLITPIGCHMLYALRHYMHHMRLMSLDGAKTCMILFVYGSWRDHLSSWYHMHNPIEFSMANPVEHKRHAFQADWSVSCKQVLGAAPVSLDECTFIDNDHAPCCWRTRDCQWQCSGDRRHRWQTTVPFVMRWNAVMVFQFNAVQSSDMFTPVTSHRVPATAPLYLEAVMLPLVYTFSLSYCWLIVLKL